MQGMHCRQQRSTPRFWEGKESMGATVWPNRHPAPSSISVVQGQKSHTHMIVSLSSSRILLRSVFGDNQRHVQNII